MSIPEPNSGCWLWLKTLDKMGYGKMGTAMGKVVAAHRLSFEAFKYDPGKLSVLHHCDMPSCVNPEHLFTGTQRDNIQDCIAKGRFKPGGVLQPKKEI